MRSVGLWNYSTSLHRFILIPADSAKNILYVDSFDSAKMIVNNNGGVSIGNANIPPANGLYVSGKVGIGTNTPDGKVHVRVGTK